jgi:hypothetical protein
MAVFHEQDETLARKLGYAVIRSPRAGASFVRDDRHVWSTRLGWQTADLDNGSYVNHKIFANLPDALERPL